MRRESFRAGLEPSAEEIARRLDLRPHPEGGLYRETFRDRPPGGGRGSLTAIYYLLRAGEVSAWHRVHDAVEVWHHYAGAPLELLVSGDGRELRSLTLGDDLAAGELPQATVPAGAWQSARPLGAWTLAGCTVAPAFQFAGFEMAPAGWRPGLVLSRPA
ncbi:MAG TPA: cupin domain-containing protein [Thermoanaerobaculia bacterium]|nr:cupin domain-containing protein [Thermoanaerobaculia bacterium]